MFEGEPIVRVLFTCSGIGVMNRGIESFFREAFDGLKQVDGLELLLLKGAGPHTRDEHPIWNLPRTSRAAQWLGRAARRNGYVVEQWSSWPSVVRHVRLFRPAVIFYSDANLGFLLYRLRPVIGVPYRLLFSNGGPVHPPFVRTDYVHQVAPCYYEEALRAGESPGKHFFVPYGIRSLSKPTLPGQDKGVLRRKLGLPIGPPIILSVGWIRSVHKRMDYVIREIARLPPPRPFLQLLGAIDHHSLEIIALGNQLLGPGKFAVNSVPYEQVFDYYQAADCFVLASLEEGFGRVYLEALMHGLPVIAHRNAVTEFVLGSAGILGDLTLPGALADLLVDHLEREANSKRMENRWQSVRERFSWEVLAPAYRDMFRACAGLAGRRSFFSQTEAFANPASAAQLSTGS